MKRLIVMIVLLAGAWSAYWFYASSQKRAALEGWFTEKQQEGWTAFYEGMAVMGFPNRVDATIAKPRVANQDGSIEWQAPFLQLLSLVYKPNHVIVVWPHDQTLVTPYSTIALRQDDLRASVVFDGDEASSLDRFSLVGEKIEARTDRGSWQAAEFLLAAERLTGATSDYRVALTTKDMSVSLPFPGSNALPDRIESLALNTNVAFEHPWDANSFLFDRPKPTKLEVVSADITWGPIELQASGTLELDDTGTPEGELDFSLNNWEELIGDIANSGSMSHQQAQSIMMMISMMASSSGDPRTFDGTLTFSGGMMRLGQLPIGPAPRISPH